MGRKGLMTGHHLAEFSALASSPRALQSPQDTVVSAFWSPDTELIRGWSCYFMLFDDQLEFWVRFPGDES